MANVAVQSGPQHGDMLPGTPVTSLPIGGDQWRQERHLYVLNTTDVSKMRSSGPPCVGVGNFQPLTGEGYVSPKEGHYDEAARKHVVDVLLFETFGGFGPDVVKRLDFLAAEVGNRLSASQHDETSWSARSWKSYQSQKLSVQLHLAVSYEIASELGIAAVAGVDPRQYAL